MVKLKSHKIKHTTLCDLLSVLVKHWFPVFHHRIFKSKHLPVAFYLKVKVFVQIRLDCPVHFMQFLFALREKLLMQLEKINAEDSRPVKDLSYLKNFLKMDFESVYDSLSIPERRELWRSIVKEIRVDHDKNIHIIFL